MGTRVGEQKTHLFLLPQVFTRRSSKVAFLSTSLCQTQYMHASPAQCHKRHPIPQSESEKETIRKARGSTERLSFRAMPGKINVTLSESSVINQRQFNGRCDDAQHRYSRQQLQNPPQSPHLTLVGKKTKRQIRTVYRDTSPNVSPHLRQPLVRLSHSS